MRSLPAKLWVLGILAGLAYFLFLTSEHLVPKICAAGIAVCILIPCFTIIQADEETGVACAAVITFLGASWRSVGPGPVIIFRPFLLPIERVRWRTTLRHYLIQDRITIATTDHRVVCFDLGITYTPIVKYLLNALKHGDAHEEVIKDRIKPLISEQVKKRLTRGDVLHEIEAITDSVEESFKQQFSRECGVSASITLNNLPAPLELREG